MLSFLFLACELHATPISPSEILTKLKAFSKDYELPEHPNYVHFSSLQLHHLSQFHICPSAFCSQIIYIYDRTVMWENNFQANTEQSSDI
jgi:hypothetical protein